MLHRRCYRSRLLCGVAAALLIAVALADGGAPASAMQGPNNPSTVVDDPSVGMVGWASPEDAAVDDGQYAVVLGDSHYLKATGFGFSIPSGATIDGIKVAVEADAIFTCGIGVGTIALLDARIVKGGIVGATNRASSPTFEDDDIVYGGPADLWGEMWTVSDIDAADFGFVFRVETSAPFIDCVPLVRVDVITISVFYTGCGDGEIGPGEACDDGNLAAGDCCSPTCQFEAAGSPCPSDGNPCNGAETCDGLGECESGPPLDCDDDNLCTQDSCHPVNGCVNDGTPVVGCRTALKSLLILKDKSPDEQDKLLWKWSKGASTAQAEFGVPTGTTQYALCIYAGLPAPLAYAVGADPVKWSAIGEKGYRYKNPTGSAGGITKLLLKGSAEDASTCRVKGAGANLADAPLEQLDDDGLVTVQLVNDSTSVCFESAFTAADFRVVDNPAKFKAKSP